MREINLTVIGDITFSTTRVYLEYLKKNNFRPKNLWLMRFLPKISLVRRAECFLGNRVAHWLHSRQSMVPFEHQERFTELCLHLQHEAASVEVKLFGHFDFHEYASNVVKLTAEGYDDPWFQKFIKSHKDTAFLYTNGGIVPECLLAEPEVKIFHVHPGVVPTVRGSDALIWSFLTNRNIGASCFFMSPGIDEGQLLKAANFSIPSLSVLQSYVNETDEDLALAFRTADRRTDLLDLDGLLFVSHRTYSAIAAASASASASEAPPRPRRSATFLPRRCATDFGEVWSCKASKVARIML